MLEAILLNVFVYFPAAMFYVLIGAYIWTHRKEKKNKQMHEDDCK